MVKSKMAGKIFQKLNKKTGAYQKYKTMPNGRLQILNVKQINPKKPFSKCRIKK